MNILVVTLRFPYPPLKGDQVVSYNRIRNLAVNHNITLLTYINKSTTKEDLREIEKYCKVIAIKTNTVKGLFYLIKNIIHYPLQVAIYAQIDFIKTFQSIVSSNKFDVIHLFLLRSTFLLNHTNHNSIILDLIDSMQYNFQQLGNKTTNIFKKFIYLIELKRLRHYEPWAISKARLALFVSSFDSNFIKGFSNKKVTIRNGVDFKHFLPTEEKLKSFTIAFSGKLDYLPNVEAVLWFASIFKKIKKQYPDIYFLVIGGGWSSQLNSLKMIDGIQFSGYVDNLAKTLAECHIAVAPMLTGSGMQNKVLEAMSCGIPVILTEKAKGDISLEDNVNCLLANSESEIMSAVKYLIVNPEKRIKLGKMSRAYIEENHDWEKINNQVSNIYKRMIS